MLMRTILVIFVATAAPACARVRPWQRGELARPHLSLSPNPHAEQLDRSLREITEGATFAGGAPGGAGAGCGCH
jgi:hypothetical protein